MAAAEQQQRKQKLQQKQQRKLQGYQVCLTSLIPNHALQSLLPLLAPRAPLHPRRSATALQPHPKHATRATHQALAASWWLASPPLKQAKPPHTATA